MNPGLGIGAALLSTAIALAACGGASKRSASSTSPASVRTCLQRAGYGVTVVPSSDVTGDAAENRGPGQTGELLVGEHGARPHVGSDDADAVIAFWNSHARAANSPNARAQGLGNHADTVGKITVQPTAQLVMLAFESSTSPSARRAEFYGEVRKIERCA